MTFITVNGRVYLTPQQHDPSKRPAQGETRSRSGCGRSSPVATVIIVLEENQNVASFAVRVMKENQNAFIRHSLSNPVEWS